MITDICSKCHEDGLHCKCDQFHPNLPNFIIQKGIVVNENEIKSLIDYFYKRAGYISPEFDQEVLNFIKRLDNYGTIK